MAFYLTQRTWAGFINICREIWEPQLLCSVEVNLPIGPSPAQCCRRWCVSDTWRQPSSSGCGCAASRHSCPSCSSQPIHDLFSCPCSLACICKGQSMCTFTSGLRQTHQPCAFWRALLQSLLAGERGARSSGTNGRLVHVPSWPHMWLSIMPCPEGKCFMPPSFSCRRSCLAAGSCQEPCSCDSCVWPCRLLCSS